MDRAALDSLEREQLIEIILAQAMVIEQLTRRVAELEAPSWASTEDTG